MTTMLKKLWKDEEGPTTVEYALMLVLVALAVAAVAPGIGNAVTTVFNAASTSLTVP
jgi:pilus assembly protein Flp/PilA